jgi:hypothetical protein
MIVALLLGRKGSLGFPGKNTFPVLGKPLAWYPMNAAKSSGVVDQVYLSTDDEQLMGLAAANGVEVINRPEHLCTAKALGEDAFFHGYQVICERLQEKPELLVLLFCNAPTVSSAQIREGVSILRADPSADSAITVSRYNMWSPLRARRLDPDGRLRPFVPFDVFGNPQTLNCDRDSQGDVWFADVALSVVRPSNLENMENGLLPQKWMGRKIRPIFNEAGLDVDYEWQLPQVEWWLHKHRILEEE